MNKDKQWKDEFNYLREIILEYPLTEEMKWMHPCYTLNDKNVVLIHGFKNYCALLFHKGVLLTDEHQLLVQQTKNVQAARQLRFTTLDEIKEQRDIIKSYIMEAIEIEKSGREVEMKSHDAYEIPDELAEALRENQTLHEAFYQLTPGRQRAYILNISQAKRTETRRNRIEKYSDQILQGKGLND